MEKIGVTKLKEAFLLSAEDWQKWEVLTELHQEVKQSAGFAAVDLPWAELMWLQKHLCAQHYSVVGLVP